MRTVNPDRTRRYLQRTMTRPPESYVLTAQERDEMAAWENAWMRNEPEPPTPPVVEWRRQVEAYCKAKGLRLSMTVEENPAGMSATLRWMGESA